MDDSQKIDLETQALDKVLLKIFEDTWKSLHELDEVSIEFPTGKAEKMLRKYKRVCRLNSADDIRQNIIDLIESQGDCTALSVFGDIVDAVELGLDSDWD